MNEPAGRLFVVSVYARSPFVMAVVSIKTSVSPCLKRNVATPSMEVPSNFVIVPDIPNGSPRLRLVLSKLNVPVRSREMVKLGDDASSRTFPEDSNTARMVHVPSR